MRRKTLILAAICLSILPEMAFAQAVYIGSSDTSSVSLEVRTVRKKSGFIQAWVEYNDLNFTPKATSSKALMRFRCEEEDIAIASTVRYSKSNGTGEVVSSVNHDFPSYSPAVPDSIGESILRFVCAYHAGEAWTAEVVQSAIDAEAAAKSAAAAADAAMEGPRDVRNKINKTP